MYTSNPNVSKFDTIEKAKDAFAKVSAPAVLLRDNAQFIVALYPPQLIEDRCPDMFEVIDGKD